MVAPAQPTEVPGSLCWRPGLFAARMRQWHREGGGLERRRRADRRRGHADGHRGRAQERCGRAQERRGRAQERHGRAEERHGRAAERRTRVDARTLKKAVRGRLRHLVARTPATWVAFAKICGLTRTIRFSGFRPRSTCTGNMLQRSCEYGRKMLLPSVDNHVSCAQPILMIGQLCCGACENGARRLAAVYRNAMLALESLSPHVVVGSEVRQRHLFAARVHGLGRQPSLPAACPPWLRNFARNRSGWKSCWKSSLPGIRASCRIRMPFGRFCRWNATSSAGRKFLRPSWRRLCCGGRQRCLILFGAAPPTSCYCGRSSRRRICWRVQRLPSGVFWQEAAAL